MAPKQPVTLFDLSEQNDTRGPRRARSKTKSRVLKQRNYDTWTRAELVLADWLLQWALARITNGFQVFAYVEMRKRVRAALVKKDEQLLARFLQCKPPHPQEIGARWDKLWRLFQRTLEREPF